MPPVPPTPLRIGVLGAANIARAFCAGVAPSKRVVVAAIASRETAKAERFAREVGVARWHGTYEALLADPAIDAIYNPLPNSLHAVWSIRAAEAGKHVLCEKPLCAGEAEARAIFAAARRHGVHIVEAYPYRSQPQTLKLKELIDAGAIGRVQLVRASFGINIADPKNIRWDAALAGGALMDAGSYPVSLVRLVAGARPLRVHAVARWSQSDVDRTLVATMEFASGLLAQISCSFGTAYHRHAQLAGESGAIETTYLNHPPMGGPPVLQVWRGARSDSITTETVATAPGNGFLLEAESFQAMVMHGASAWNGATPEESIDIAMTLEAILKSARSGAMVDLPG
ncbi:MAG: Gfo/Idh/MocA family oxidoreductase [Alphaproteobacteria bacterium]|nr:Gfo/Idh/MocA family oxidoreductase [Alphaproteobacteria bacterium]